MAKINLKKFKEGKKKSNKKVFKESVAKRESEFIEKSIANKLNVIEDRNLPALEAVEIKGNTIEHWISDIGRAKIQTWKRNGLSVREISDCMGVSYNTLLRWQKEFSLIREALSLGREELVMSAEHALLQKALGYESTERQVTVDNEGKEVVRQTTKHIPPDFSALQFFLINMKPDVWKNKQDVSVDASVQGRFTNMTDEELNKVMDRFNKIVGGGE